MTKKTRKIEFKYYIRILLLVLALVCLDQWTKYLAVSALKDRPPFVLIENVLELRYLENSGAAFSMLEGRQIFLRLLTVAFLVLAVFFIVRIPKKRKYVPLLFNIGILIAGALGNFIDRIRQAYVVDFIYISAIDFPIFNVADIYVTVGAILLAVLLLFHYKEEDLAFLGKH